LISVASAVMGWTGAAAQENGGQPGIHPNKAIPTRILPLDGSNRLLAVDPKNVGRQEKWYEKPRPDALQTQVPWVIQDAFPDYHGVAWYWRDFTAPGNPHPAGRYVLRFRAVDYLAEIWLNDVPIGLHEGLEEPFEFDVTSAIKPESSNRLAVRVLNPTDIPIDGMRITEVPVGRRENGTPRDNAYNTGGIIDSVELLASPSVRVENLQVVPDWKTGAIRVRARVRNSGDKPVPAQVQWTVAPATGGESIVAGMCGQDLVAGDTLVETRLRVPHHRLWELNNPYLYRVTASVRAIDSPSVDERSVRCGFRVFRFEDGYFRLNGRRIRLHGGLYTALQYPVSMSVPHDEEWVRRDVLNMKVMGFNIARITCGAALPARQLDLFDELGLLVCEEHFGADSSDSKKRMAETAQLEKRWDRSIAAVIRRDRNHPSIVLWSLLNEVKDGRLFRHAVQSLPFIRELDDSRMILLNSGRFDGDNNVGSWSSPGSLVWEQINLRDVHDYPTFPHSAEAIRRMRGLQGGGASPMLLSEYGVCGAQDYARFTRNFEQLGKEHVTDARIYKACLDRFMDDWKKWRLDECWARPEDYFLDSQRNQAKLALDDYNAWMSNPTLIGDFTSTQIVDAWYHGCGITSYFREPKPGMADAYQDMAAKVRFCLFVEPVNVYRGTKVRLEAVLVNLDALQPGKYPVSLQVVGPKQKRLLQKTIAIEIPQIRGRPEPPFAQPVFAEDLAVEGRSGKYRFLATFEHGAAAGGGDVEMYVGDPADMPAVTTEVTLWGEDAELAQWLS